MPAAIGLLLLLCLPSILIVRLYQTANRHLLAPGDRAPELTARDLASNEMHRFSFEGRPAALLFFSTDCPHCQREITNFELLNERFGDHVLFLSISMSSKEKTTAFLSSHRLGVNTLLDELGIGLEAFGVDVVPALILIGPDESIAYSDVGEKTFAERERLLSEFVNSLRLTPN